MSPGSNTAAVAVKPAHAFDPIACFSGVSYFCHLQSIQRGVKEFVASGSTHRLLLLPPSVHSVGRENVRDPWLCGSNTASYFCNLQLIQGGVKEFMVSG
jgi:hypothetical protein